MKTRHWKVFLHLELTLSIVCHQTPLAASTCYFGEIKRILEIFYRILHLKNTYLGIDGLLRMSDISIFAQNIIVIPLSHKSGLLIHFPVEKITREDYTLSLILFGYLQLLCFA